MIGQDLVYASEQLKQGLTVGIPTETVYGLAANALNEEAILSIFKIKNRPHFDPLIVHVASIEDVSLYTEGLNGKAKQLAELFWPGPLTLLLKRNDKIPLMVSSGSDKLAIRIPQHPLTLKLLSMLDFPLAAPSANPFGYISPTQAEHVEKQLGDKTSYILDGGNSNIGLESTIVDCTEEVVKVVRLGGISIEKIEEALGERVELKISQNSNPSAPGQLDSHYSPKKRFVVVDNIGEDWLQYKHYNLCLLNFGEHELPEGIFELNLSKAGNLDEAAMNLFHYMRLLDELDTEMIVAQKLPSIGLGKAINDRMQRASHKL
jgi:L-threonylcarbamoyladenylate synthase